MRLGADESGASLLERQSCRFRHPNCFRGRGSVGVFALPAVRKLCDEFLMFSPSMMPLLVTVAILLMLYPNVAAALVWAYLTLLVLRHF